VRWALALAACALALGGCSLSDEEPGSRSGPATRTVETTRVEVVEGSGRDGSFDPPEIYRRLSPGVVTVISSFPGHNELLGGGEAGLGSGFVLDGRGYIATNAHVVTVGEAPRIRRATEVPRSRQSAARSASGSRSRSA
jgi:S1-C subfamily serine protease